MAPLARRRFHFAGPDVENPDRYRPGGYHPVHLGDVYDGRYKVIHKLGFGTYSTVWLARDIKCTAHTQYVALKFVVAELTGRNREVTIYRHLDDQSREKTESRHILRLLHRFKVKGANGEHEVLVLEVVGPHLEDMFNDEPTTIRQSIKDLMHQVALGISFLHRCGVIHADLHKGNIAFEIPTLDGKPERNAMMALGPPRCVPVVTLDDWCQQPDSLPKYLVLPGSLVGYVKHDDLHVKIIDFGQAFLNTELPQDLCTPLRVRAPEALFNHLSTAHRIELGTRIDVWSMGCLVYELATSGPLIGYAYEEVEVLHQLANLLGPLPKEWIGLLGTSYAIGTPGTSLEQCIGSTSEVDDTPGLTAVLQQILKFDPVQRPSALDILSYPWFTSSSSGSESE